MKIGDIVKCIGNGGGANYQIGKKYVLVHQLQPGYWQARDPESGWIGNNIMEIDLELCPLTRNELKKKLEDMEDEAFRVKMMLNYLDEEKKDEVVVNEFFAWHLVKLIDSDDKNKKEKISKILTTMSNSLDIKVITQR